MNWYKQSSSYLGYHGTSQNFEEFSYKFMGSTGTSHGFGFYFTSNDDVARMFSDNGIIKKAMLEINKPINNEGRTITVSQFAKFLRALDSTGEDYLSNWGDVYSEGYESVLRKAINGEMKYAKNDVDLISGIIQAQGRNAEFVYNILKQTLGYDGIIINNPDWGGSQVIYIVFDNSQIRYV